MRARPVTAIGVVVLAIAPPVAAARDFDDPAYGAPG